MEPIFHLQFTLLPIQVNNEISSQLNKGGKNDQSQALKERKTIEGRICTYYLLNIGSCECLFRPVRHNRDLNAFRNKEKKYCHPG